LKLQGLAAFYGGQQNPPEGVNLSMRFIETEFWTTGNFNDSGDPEDVYTGEASPSVSDSVKERFDRPREMVKNASKDQLAPMLKAMGATDQDIEQLLNNPGGVLR
jgi:hypothetical protein